MKQKIEVNTNALIIVTGLAVDALAHDIIPPEYREASEASVIAMAEAMLKEGVITHEELAERARRKKAGAN